MSAKISNWFVYMLECKGDRLYTGIAVDVGARFKKHCSGTGAAFTRMHKPLRIAAVMPCADRSAASKMEAQLKSLDRSDKLLWAKQWPWVGETGC